MPVRKDGQQQEAIDKALRHFPSIPDDALVGFAVSRVLFGSPSRATAYRRIEDGTYPPIVKIGGSNFMRAGDIRRVLNSDLPRKAA